MSSIVLFGLRPLGDSKKNTKQLVERRTKSRARPETALRHGRNLSGISVASGCPHLALFRAVMMNFCDLKQMQG